MHQSRARIVQSEDSKVNLQELKDDYAVQQKLKQSTFMTKQIDIPCKTLGKN